MKKVISLLLAVLLAVSVFASVTIPAGAAELQETEDNDYSGDANLIPLGSSMSGVIRYDFDCDYFKVISNENGKINLNLNLVNPVDTANRKGWWVVEYDSNVRPIGMTKVDLATKTTVVLPFIGAKAGNYYYVAILPGYGAPGGVMYTIRTSFTKGEYYEKENNDSEAKATDIVLAHDYVGTINGDFTNADSDECYDNDYFHIKTPAKGTLTISFKHKKIDGTYPYTGWDFTLYHHHNGGDQALDHVQFTPDSAETTKIGSGSYDKNKELWISIKSLRELYYHDHSPSVIEGEPYTISTTFVLASKPKLTATTTNNSVKLTSTKLSDITGYQVENTTDGKKSTVKGATLSYTAKNLKASKTYKFRVRTYLKKDNTTYYGKWVDISAKTKSAEKTISATPKLSAATTASSVTLTSKKLSNITGYTVQMLTGSAYKAVSTVKKAALKVTKTKLKKNTTYTFRVRAYLKKGGKTYYGKWVTIKVKTKKK